MKIFGSIIFLSLIGFAFIAAPAQTEPASVKIIRKAYADAARRIAEGENGPSDLFVAEIQTNRTDNQFPAVGTYRPVIRFYYTFGDREKNPYPDRLVKATVEIDRAARKELSEFLYDKSGRLIFFFRKTDEGEQRVYFSSAAAVWALDGEKPLKTGSAEVRKIAGEASRESLKMTTIFRSLLSF